jgi:hypothetical protein
MTIVLVIILLPGQILFDICERNGLIANKWFKRPGKHQEIEIDIVGLKCILLKQRFRKCERCADSAGSRY